MRASMWRRRRKRRMRKVWIRRRRVWVYLRKKVRSEYPLTVTRSSRSASRPEKMKP